MILSQSNIDLPSWSSGSRRRPLTAETRVRFPMGVPNVKTHLNDVFFRFKSSLGNRTGGLSAQSCELCARPGVIAQTYQKVVQKPIKMCACVVRAICIGQAERFPMGVPNVKTHLNDVFFSFQIILRESNGRISTQSCELCARPGVIISIKTAKHAQQQYLCCFCDIANFQFA